MKVKFEEFILETKVNTKGKTIVAYHGSPYKFEAFDDDKKGDSGQVGADIGFWFTTEKRVAMRFANVYPAEMYEKQKKLRTEKTKEIDNKLINAIKKMDFDKFSNFLKDDYGDYVYLLKKAVDDENYEEVKKLVSYISIWFGKRNLPEDIKKELLEYDSIIANTDGEIEKEVNNIKEWYDKNHKGYLYTVELNMGRSGTENGEDIGTNWGRHGTISQYEAEGYDSVFIKFADTGQGLADEIVIFNNKNIKIIKVEEV